MSTESENKYWWLDQTVNECKLCSTKFKTITPSALKHHSITNKHQKNFDKQKHEYSSSSIKSSNTSSGIKTSEHIYDVKNTVRIIQKTHQSPSLKRRRDFDQNANEKKKRMGDRSAIKSLYDFYLSSKITEISTESGLLKGEFFTVLNGNVTSGFCQMFHEDVGTKPFSLFLENVESEDRSNIGIAIRSVCYNYFIEIM